MTRTLMGLALMSCAGCGVAGHPLPPGPRAAAAPTLAAPISTPDGIRIELSVPLRDVDGDRIDAAALWAFADAECIGRPLARGDERGLALPREAAGREVHVVAVRAGRPSPSTPVTLTWTAPPPPPEAPLVFVDQGGVQIAWLPPPPPIDRVLVYRGQTQVADLPAEGATWTDADAPTGRHIYRIGGAGPGVHSALSTPVEVDVSRP